jgi:hypothetical protein
MKCVNSIAIFTAFLVTLTVQTAFADNRVALVVGVSEYGEASLANSMNDAELVNRALKEANFETTLLSNPNLERLREAVNTLKRSAMEKGKDTTVLFYFAGHGTQVNGNNYLIPAKSNLVLKKHTEEEYDARSMEAQLVLDKLSETVATRILLVLDVCRTNPIRPGHRGGEPVHFSPLRMHDSQKTMIIFSTEATHEASDGLTSEKNSPFTSAFVDELKKPGLDMPDLFLNVQEQVRNTTNNEQRPWISGLFHFQFFANTNPPPKTVIANAASDFSLGKPQEAPKPQATSTTQAPNTPQEAPKPDSTDAKPVKPAQPAEQTAPQQMVSDLHGVVEIGGKGVKTTFLGLSKEDALKIEHQMDEREDGIKYKMMDEFKDKMFGAKPKDSVPEINTNITDRANIKATIDAVAASIQKLKDNHAVSDKNIYVVASSGVAMLTHFQEFKQQLQQSLNVKLEAITPAYECELTFRWVVPKYRYRQAVVIDTGSASTSACYLEQSPAKFRSFNLLPYGTMTFKKLIQDDMGKRGEGAEKFTQAATRMRTMDIERKLEAKLRENPGLATGKRLYLTGGIVWATSSLVRPQEVSKNWTPFSPQDIGTLSKRLTATRGGWNTVDYSAILEQDKAKVIKNVQKVKDVFTNQEDVISGLQLLYAMNVKLRWTTKEKIFFANIARDAWRTQYLIDKISGHPN